MIEEVTLDQAFLPPAPLPQDERKRGGLILIDARAFESLNISLRDCNTQGLLEDTGVFAEVHKKLQLPQNFIIRGMLSRYLDSAWSVWVTSPDLPVVADYTDPPGLNLIYQRLGDGTIHLHKIKIGDEWERVYSQPIACPTCGRVINRNGGNFDGGPYETQFALFADAVMSKLCDLRDGELVDVISDQWRKQAELVLARCAYQFACHVSSARALISHGDMTKVPDMSEVPDCPEEMGNNAG